MLCKMHVTSARAQKLNVDFLKIKLQSVKSNPPKYCIFMITYIRNRSIFKMDQKGSHQILESGYLWEAEEGSEMWGFSTAMLVK